MRREIGIVLALVAGIVVGVPSRAAAQMSSPNYSTYNDGEYGGDGYVYGWSSVDDDVPQGCDHSNYETTTYLTSPTGRYASSESGGTSSNAVLEFDDESGYWDVGTEGYLFCSCAGTNLYYSGESPLTITFPTSETTFGNAWAGLANYATVYKWRATVSNGSFSFTGRTVTEYDGGNGNDTCWFPNSSIPPQVRVSGGSWTIDGSNQYGDDGVGWTENAVQYYRSAGRAPCQTEFDQIMKMNNPNGPDVAYKTNRLKAGFTSTSVWSERDGHAVSKSY